MNRASLFASFIAISTLITVVAVCLHSTFAQSPPQRTQWEYKIDLDSRGLQAALDALGNDGWELVCSIPQSGSDSVKIVFKRAR